MLLFFSIIVLILIGIFILIFSDVKLIIEYLRLSNDSSKFELEYKGKICLYLMGKIKLLSFKIDNSKNKNSKINVFISRRIEKIKKESKYNNKRQKEIRKKILKQIKEKVRLKLFKLKLFIGTQNIILTSYLVGIISSIIPNIIRNNIDSFSYEKFKLKILPIYENQNYIYLELNSIISIKLVHIINMFKLMGGIKNERSPNRGLNVNCYGKY